MTDRDATRRVGTPTITSLKDDRLATVRALETRSGRAAAGACLLEGATLIAQAVAADARLRFAVHADDVVDPLAETLAARGVPVFPVRGSLLRQALRLAKPVAWVAVAELSARTAEYGDFAVVLDGVRDPGNLGTIVRTAVALGVADVVCTDDETDLTGRKVLDASRSAVLRARIHRYPSPVVAVHALREQGFEVVATSSHATTVQAHTPLRGRRMALVVGNETDGVSADALAAADHVVRIPMAGGVESLNVGVAAGISLYELTALAARHG
ncbi:MAG TPA: RNA methyltransferase [Pseudonocardiaceae bacterium]|jgi:TrmH family RNA methyltransferase|nr:RNA methyltransferase [Pseudonocardiaceae bacterium]